MKKKIFVYMLTLCLIVACSFALTACNNEEHHIGIMQNDYLNISTNVSTAKSEEKVTISYTKKENFVEKPGYELKLMVKTNDHKTIVVNYDESDKYYFIMPDCDVSISAEYLPIQYTITYDLNGGENNANNPTTYTVDSNDIIISQPVRSGFYFWGWTINDGSQIVRDYTIPSGTTGNITLKANWKIRVLNYDNYIHWKKPTYTGEKFSVNASDFIDAKHQNIDQFVEISGDTKATNAGTYNVTLSLKDKVNYCWDDGTTEDKTATWEIVKAKLTVTRPSYIHYSGEEISVTSEDFTGSRLANLVDITGTTSATNVGTYNVTLSLKDKANTTWEDGTTEDKTTTWEIVKRHILIIDYKSNSGTYSGEEIFASDLVLLYSSDVDFVNITGTVSATNAGVYEVTLSLKDKENTIWSGETTEDKTITWEIKRFEIEFYTPGRYAPYYYSTEYSGYEKSVSPSSFVHSEYIEFINITGTTNATTVGIYNVTLTLKDKVNYCWDDGTTEDKTAQWRITIKVYINLPVTEEYNGYLKSVTSSDFADLKYRDLFTVSGGTTSAINVGTYSVILSLKENYCWEDGTTEDKTVQWSIVPAKVYLDTPAKRYTGNVITVTPSTFINWDYSHLYTISENITISGTTSATELGTYNVTLSLIDKVNYCWEDGTTEDKTAQWSIVPAKVSLNLPVTKQYTGDAITITPTDFADLENSKLFTISGTASATNVGTYNVTLSLKENYCWEDGTIEDKNVTWEIVKAKLTVTRYTPLYTGEEKIVTSVNLISEDEYADFVTVSGQTSATEPGAYTVTLSLNDKINMTWSDGTTDDKTVKWKIQRLDWKNNVAVSAFVKKIYTGEEITVTSADFILAEEYADYITISGQTSGTEKGTYTVTISLADKENMTWDDDTTEDKTVQWIIAD